MKRNSPFLKLLAIVMCVSLTATNSLLAYSIQSNFWSHRQKSLSQAKKKLESPNVLAQLPVDFNPVSSFKPHLDLNLLSSKSTLSRFSKPLKLAFFFKLCQIDMVKFVRSLGQRTQEAKKQ